MKQSGVSGLLDVARQTFKEATGDVHQHVTNINRKLLFGTSSLDRMLADFFFWKNNTKCKLRLGSKMVAAIFSGFLKAILMIERFPISSSTVTGRKATLSVKLSIL
jgi:hypothetical protein